MSYWIRVLCPESLARLRPETLFGALHRTADWDIFAEWQDLPAEAADEACAETRIEDAGESPETFTLFMLHYRPGPSHFIRIERWSGADAREELDEIRDDLLASYAEDTPGLDRVLDVVEASVETIAFELKASDTASMGWPVAYALAMILGEWGGGLVLDEDRWWDPLSGDPLLSED